MADQLLMYDTAMKSWVSSQFGSLISGKTLHITVGTPDRAFAEYVTPTGIDPDGRPPMPRAALTLGDPEVDPERFNAYPIRKLGYADSTKRTILQADYPTPVNIPYTLNFWTEYIREMNLLVQKLLQQFRFQYLYLPVDIDTVDPTGVYGTKDIGLFAEGSVADTGDVEPGQKERLIRRTMNMHLKAWLWDLDFDEVPVVKSLELETYRDRELTLLFEIAKTPSEQHLFTGATGVVSFSGSVDQDKLPIIQQTLHVDALVGGSLVRGCDDGSGVINGTGIASGTVDYSTGAVAITYDTAPDDGEPIYVGYYTRV